MKEYNKKIVPYTLYITLGFVGNRTKEAVLYSMKNQQKMKIRAWEWLATLIVFTNHL